MNNPSDSPSSADSRFSVMTVLASVVRFFGVNLFLGLLIAVGSIFLFGWLADEIFEGATIKFDDVVRAGIHSAASPALTLLMKIITELGSTLFLSIFSLIAAGIFYYQNHKRGLILFVITMLGEVVLLISLKTGFKRVRPEPFFEYALPSSFSFPSGHSLSSFCFYGILAWLITARMKNRRLKAAIWAAAAILILLIGLSRIYLGVHYPSDVLAGYAAGSVWVMTVALGDFFLHRRKQKKQNAGDLQP